MKKGQVIRNDATGEMLTMLVSDEDNGGACQLHEVRLPPAARVRRFITMWTSSRRSQ
jgi:hypothetical protein